MAFRDLLRGFRGFFGFFRGRKPAPPRPPLPQIPVECPVCGGYLVPEEDAPAYICVGFPDMQAVLERLLPRAVEAVVSRQGVTEPAARERLALHAHERIRAYAEGLFARHARGEGGPPYPPCGFRGMQADYGTVWS